MGQYLFAIYIIITASLNAFSQADSVYISLQEKTYQNIEISFYKYEDLITHTPVLLLKKEADSTGKLETNFAINETQEIFALAGKNKLKFFVEPGKEYKIAVPPYTPITLADELNPFFTYNELYTGIVDADKNELNRQIADFDSYFDELVEKHFNYLYIYGDKHLLDSLLKDTDSLFPQMENQFFENYKTYKISQFKHFGTVRELNWASKSFFLNKPILYKNPAYMHFFSQLFRGYFSKDLHTDFKQKLKENIIYDKSSRLLKENMDFNLAMRNDTLKELIILQGLFDCFSDQQNFPRNTVYQTLDSLQAETSIPMHAEIAKNIRDTVYRLEAGDFAPDFSFKTLEGETFKLSEQKSFIYLNVCRSENYACIQDYKLIKDIADLQLPDLQIVTVSFDQNFESFKMFSRTFPDFTWKFLFGDKKSFLNDYQVKAMPSYFLIDPEGRIVMLPAASPHENFKLAYKAIWNSFQRMKAKKANN